MKSGAMKKHQDENEDIGTALEDTGPRLVSPHFLPHVVDVADDS